MEIEVEMREITLEEGREVEVRTREIWGRVEKRA